MEILVSSTPRGDPQPSFPTHTILLDPHLGAEWFSPVVFHSPSKVPFCFSLVGVEPIKSHFLLFSSIKEDSEDSRLTDMEAEHAFQIYLIQYQGVHLSDYITFMTQFRIIVNGLKPPEIINLHTDTEQCIVELLTKCSLNMILWTFFASEPLLVLNQRTCPVTTWSRRLPKEKVPSFKLCGLCMTKPAYTVWHIRLGNEIVHKT
ncbi:hypothetical protein TNCV_4488091 [Trichonephila clavipes]|nr:hypothetical protein TNCV_4488091 [Trichonephila clavipes]